MGAERNGWGRSRARGRVFARDLGICSVCDTDTDALKRQQFLDVWNWQKRVIALGFNPLKSLWEMDHVTPLVDGGRHEMGNLQTLCQPCHKIKTRAENSARVQLRRVRQTGENGGVSFL